MDFVITMKPLKDTDHPGETVDYYWPHEPKNDTEWEAAGFAPVEKTQHGLLLSFIAINVLDSSLTKVFFPVVYIIIFIVGLPTNAMAIWVFLFRTKKKHPASILMVNLALADLLFIILLPLKIAYHFNGNNWIFGEPLCKVLVGFFFGNMYCSTIFIACISVQRYWLIVHPLSQQKRNNQAAVCVCACVWVIVWLITVPLYLYDQTVDVVVNEKHFVICHDVTDMQSHIPVGYFMTMSIVGYVVPCVVCTVTYVRMFLYFRSSSMPSEEEMKGQNKRKAIILITTVLVMFLVCFTPSNIMLMVHYSLLANGSQNDGGYGFYITTLCLSSLNSCLDPFLYYFISEQFREHVKNTLICRSERTVERMRVTAPKFSQRTKYYSSGSTPTESSNC